MALSLLGSAAILLLGSCSVPQSAALAPPSPPPSRPASALLPAPAPAPSVADWRDAPLTPGLWWWSSEGGRSVARFGHPGEDESLAIRCDLASRIVSLDVPAPSAGPVSSSLAASSLTIDTTSQSPSLVTQPANARMAVTISLTASDPLLDAMAFSRGRFAVAVSGQPPLILPAWPEVARVIDDCRQH